GPLPEPRAAAARDPGAELRLDDVALPEDADRRNRAVRHGAAGCRGLGLLAARDLRGPPRGAPAEAARALPARHGALRRHGADGPPRRSRSAQGAWPRRPHEQGAGLRQAAAGGPRPRGARTTGRRRASLAELPRGGAALPGRGPACPERAGTPLEGPRHAPGAVAGGPARSGATGQNRKPNRLLSELQVAFVCTGNRFRSPLAAALLAQKADGLPLRIVSLGTLDLGSEPALPEAVAIAEELGLDLSGHASRNLASVDLEPFDLVLGFERKHVVASVVEAGANIERTFTLPVLVATLRRPA